MWFLAAIFVASLVVSTFLVPKPKITNSVSGKLNDFNFPRASYGSPVPRIYGTVRLRAPNTIWSGDFKSTAITKKVKTGLFSSKRQTVGFKYYVGFDLAVCLGPYFRFRRIWSGNNELWNGCPIGPGPHVVQINLPDLFGGQDKNGGFVGEVAMYPGGFDQPRDPYLAATVDPNVPAYVGVAHVVFRRPYIGNSTSMQPIYIEGASFSNSLNIPGQKYIMPNCLDANPVEVLYDLIVNDWGNLDVDANRINVEQWRAAGERIYDENNGMSIIVANRSKGGDLAAEILTQINGTIYEDPATGLFDLVLLREDYDYDSLPILSIDEIVEVRNFTKMLWGDTYNRVRLSFTDRANGFKEDVPALAEDFANIRYQGSARTLSTTFNTVYDSELANRLAARELSNVNVPLYSMELLLTRLAANLRPGSAFILHWPRYGIDAMVCRIRKFGLGTLQNGEITASVVQDQFAVNRTVIAPPTGSPYEPPSYSPKPVTSFKLFELPYFLDQNTTDAPTEGTGRVAVLASAPGGASAAFNAFIVGNPDAEVLTTSPYANTAKLIAPLGKFDGFETGVLPTLIVGSVTQADEDELFPLKNAGEQGARSGASLFYLNNELMSYEGYADNGDGTYTLTNVRRALLDTTYGAAKAEDVLFFFDGQEGFIDDERPIDQAFKLYLQDIGVMSVYPADLAPRIDVTPIGRADLPLPADFLALDGDRSATGAFAVGDAPVLSWRPRNRLADPAAIEFETDAAETDEDGVTYRLEIAKEAGEPSDMGPIVNGDPITFLSEDEGPIVLRLFTVRNGQESYTPAEYPVSVLSATSLKIDDEFVTIDGKGIIYG